MHAISKDHPSLETPASSRLDLVGAGLSLLCLAHCTLLPVLPLLVAAIPWLANESLHLGLLALITPIAFVALVIGARRHGKRRILVWGGVGLCLLLLGAVAGETFEKPLTVLGSVMLCIAHLQNRRAGT